MQMAKFRNHAERRAALIPIVRSMLAEGKTITEIREMSDEEILEFEKTVQRVAAPMISSQPTPISEDQKCPSLTHSCHLLRR